MVGLAMCSGLGLGLERDPCRGDSDSVFINYGNCGKGHDLGVTRAQQHESEKQSTHVLEVLYWDAGWVVECWLIQASGVSRQT